MALYFDRDDIALPGFSKYFKKASAEEAEHAEKFMKFQNSRGGRVLLKDIPRPEKDEWGSPLDAMKAALDQDSEKSSWIKKSGSCRKEEAPSNSLEEEELLLAVSALTGKIMIFQKQDQVYYPVYYPSLQTH